MLKRILSWFIPSISEFEFVFFVSLFVSSLIFLVSKYFFELIPGYYEAMTPYELVIAVLGVSSLLLSMCYMAFKLFKKDKVTNVKKRISYVLIPSYFLMLISLFYFGFISAANLNQGFFQKTIASLVLVRGLVTFFIARFYELSKKLSQFLTEQFDDTQGSPLLLLILVLAGIFLGYSTTFYENWLNGFLSSYLFGSIAVKVIRRLPVRLLQYFR